MSLFTPIQDSTPVSEFPEIYNENNSILEQKISSLEAQLEAKQLEIDSLKEKFNAALNVLRSEYLTEINKLSNNNS